jgi:hypothetical protein
MRPSASTRSRLLRALALVAAVAPLGVAWAAASCIIVDPPPALPPIPAAAPKVRPVLPAEANFTNCPGTGLSFIVEVQVLNPNDSLHYVLIEDENTANATQPNPPALAPPGDGGSFTIDVPTSCPGDSNCHTFTFYADTSEDPAWSVAQGPPATVTCTPMLCARQQWFYEPSGATGCPVFDAGIPPPKDGGKDARGGS